MDNKHSSSRSGLAGWWHSHKPSKRRLIQVYAALLYNANLKGFANGKIYTGVTKKICVPGLNCYSCPGAVGACPLGSLQNALSARKVSSLTYIFGILILFGLILGRTICGFLCPFGLIQELLHKLPSPKLKKNRFTRIFSYFKYVILGVLVLIVPLGFAFSARTAVPGFCKYICPSGTLLGAIGLLSGDSEGVLFPMLGVLFTWKFCLLVLFVVASIFIFRFFCRFFCPLGAIYGFFSKVALLGVKVDDGKCTSCGLCVSHCQMDIRHVGDHECIHCGACIPSCPTKAISWKGGKIALHAQEVPAQTNETQPPKRSVKKTVLRVLPAVLAIAVLAGALVYYNVIDREAEVSRPSGETSEGVTYGYAVGNQCPDFTLPGLEGDGTFTLSEHDGEIVVLNFWATWCGPCVAELPHFERIANEYSDTVTVVAVHSNVYTDEGFIAEKGWSDYAIRFVLDENLVANFDQTRALPVTVLISQSGRIAFCKVGSMSYDALKTEIDRLLAE